MKINKRKSNKTEHANTTQNERKKSTEIPLSTSSVGQLLLGMGPTLKHGRYA